MTWQQERDEAADKIAKMVYLQKISAQDPAIFFKMGFNAALTSSIVKELVEALRCMIESHDMTNKHLPPSVFKEAMRGFFLYIDSNRDALTKYQEAIKDLK